MQQSPGPVISVIVPSYNKPEYLLECLKSIQEQTFTDWECIVVSDGSPRVAEIRAAVVAMHDKRFRLVEHKDNRGLAAARNTGVREARAELVICVDEDDRIFPECLKEELKTLEDKDCEVVCCIPEFIGGRSGLYRTRIPSLEEILSSQPLPPAGFLLKKSAWERLGGWDEHPVLRLGREDHEWWIRAVSEGIKIALIDRALYQYRVPAANDEENSSLNLRARETEVYIRRYIVQKHAELYRRYPEERRKYLRNAYLNEAAWYSTHGQLNVALVRIWQAAAISKTGKDLRTALRATIDRVIGWERAERLLHTRRRFLAAKKIVS
jgi:glycosyltransferase involved in cell wall biosynthesis